jgi:hypothetical protein
VADYDFSLNPKLVVSQARVGAGQEPVFFIDDALHDPQSLVGFAKHEVAFEPAWTANGGYPGVRAAAPLDYTKTLVRSLCPIVEDVFSLRDVRVARADCYLSIVTRPPDELAPFQRIPHIDIADPLRFAFLHYLCGADFGGTAFYRHRGTGLQTIDADREPEYQRLRDSELESDPPPADYIRGSSAYFEQTARVDARFNRLLVYRSLHLHSGMIPQGLELSPDPARGRLTANVFVTYEPC